MAVGVTPSARGDVVPVDRRTGKNRSVVPEVMAVMTERNRTEQPRARQDLETQYKRHSNDCLSLVFAYFLYAPNHLTTCASTCNFGYASRCAVSYGNDLWISFLSGHRGLLGHSPLNQMVKYCQAKTPPLTSKYRKSAKGFCACLRSESFQPSAITSRKGFLRSRRASHQPNPQHRVLHAKIGSKIKPPMYKIKSARLIELFLLMTPPGSICGQVGQGWSSSRRKPCRTFFVKIPPEGPRSVCLSMAARCSSTLPKTTPLTQLMNSTAHGMIRRYITSSPSLRSATSPACFIAARCLDTLDMPVPTCSGMLQSLGRMTADGFGRLRKYCRILDGTLE